MLGHYNLTILFFLTKDTFYEIMSLGLHNNCKARLKEVLIETLPNIVVTNNMFIQRETANKLYSTDSILPRNQKIRNELEKYIGESPFYEFIVSYLSKQLLTKQTFDSNAKDKRLIEIERYSDLSETANQMVELFDSLPWEYTVSFQIENDFGTIFRDHIKEFKLSNNVFFNVPSDKFIKEYPLIDENGKSGEVMNSSGNPFGILFPSTFIWSKECTYLNIITQGYIDNYRLTTTFKNVELLFKAIIGLGICFRLFTFRYEYHSTPYKMNVIINKKTGTEWTFEKCFELDAELSEIILDFSTMLEFRTEEQKRLNYIRYTLNDISFVLTNINKANKIILASQWFFESYLGDNELLSFIQSMIAIEILLGDKTATDLIGLGELLGNRCAYLIGASTQQRESILKEFKEIYKIRSRIVHSGERKLNIRDRYLFNTLRWMCKRVIQEEIRLMKKDEEGRSI